MSPRKSLNSAIVLAAITMARGSIAGAVAGDALTAGGAAHSIYQEKAAALTAPEQSGQSPVSTAPVAPTSAIGSARDAESFLAAISPEVKQELHDYALETWRQHLAAQRAPAKCAPTQKGRDDHAQLTDRSPRLIEISGNGADLTAVLLYPDNHRYSIQAPPDPGHGVVLPTGDELLEVHSDYVLLRPSGEEKTQHIPFNGISAPASARAGAVR